MTNNNIKLLVNDALFPSRRAIEQLTKISGDDRVFKPVVALSDIHDKEDNDYPTGVVVASERHIFPEIMVSGPNCGMRVIGTGLDYQDINERGIDKLFSSFVDNIRTKSLMGEPLKDSDVFGIFKKGAKWAVNKYGIPEEEINNIEFNGNAFGGADITEKDIERSVPSDIIRVAKYRLGLLGGGNHFLEMQRVGKIFDGTKAESLGLKLNNICFFIHSGSGGVGAAVSHIYSPRSLGSREIKMHAFVYAQWLKFLFNSNKRRYIKKIAEHVVSGKSRLFALEENSAEAVQYLTAINCAANFAYANRTYMAHQIRKIVSGQFNIKEKEVRTVYDVSHMSIRKESFKNKPLWIHRTGAVRAYPAEALDSRSSYKYTGEPIFLPSSMGGCTYVCVSTLKNDITYFSMGHGAGRLSRDRITHIPKDREELCRELESNSVKLYKGLSRKIVKQSPSCFKDIEATIKYLEGEGLIKVVAKLEPIGVLKG
jgi:tRNA-splicing ligase RtcB